MQRRLPVRVQLGTDEPYEFGWVDVDEHDGPAEVRAALANVLRNIADQLDAGHRYSRYERD